MNKKKKIGTCFILISSFVLFFSASTISANAVIRSATGANAAAIQSVVDQFRADLGTNNGVGGSFRSGRREINWDGVPDNFSAPNNLPGNFFNSNSPRGAVFNTLNSIQMRVSADSSNSTNTPVRFGDVDASYSTEFTTFSSERLFGAIHSNTNIIKQNIIEVAFFIPGTNIPATVGGFGAVFTDVDTQPNAIIEYYGVDGTRLFSAAPQATDNGLSFLGVFFNAGERVAKVVIISGTNLANGNTDGVSGRDVIVMDDFIYGEPRASQFHSGDFDGDGVSDYTVFRPSTGNFFILNSGSNTVTIDSFGTAGDIPVNGDFDGDKLADVAIYRPDLREWWVKKSSDGSNFAAQFGAAGDKPVPGDYDKDEKTDFAIFRPSNGNWFVLRSRDNFSSFFGFPFGSNGDLPVGATTAP